MGCDIHLALESYDHTTKAWKFLLPPAPPPESERTEMCDTWALNPATGRNEKTGGTHPYVSPFWGPGGCMYVRECYGITTEDGDEDGCKGDACLACLGTRQGMGWYHSRNYNVFAILTSTVRNDEVDPFEGIVPEPRGLPKDITPEALRVMSDEHSAGWLSLREILDWDGWSRVRTHTGVMPLFPDLRSPEWYKTDYASWSKTDRKCPERYSGSVGSVGSVGGKGVKTISETDARRILAAPDKEHQVTHREELRPGLVRQWRGLPDDQARREGHVSPERPRVGRGPHVLRPGVLDRVLPRLCRELPRVPEGDREPGPGEAPDRGG